MEKSLWQVFVPQEDNEGRPFSVEKHKEWDEKVIKLTNGLTLRRPVKGIWVSANGKKCEGMIPVLIACYDNEIEQIIQITKDHYAQEAVMACRISDKVLIL